MQAKGYSLDEGENLGSLLSSQWCLRFYKQPTEHARVRLRILSGIERAHFVSSILVLHLDDLMDGDLDVGLLYRAACRNSTQPYRVESGLGWHQDAEEGIEGVSVSLIHSFGLRSCRCCCFSSFPTVSVGQKRTPDAVEVW